MTNLNIGHGHVFERADGYKKECGGPHFCADCAHDYMRKVMSDAAEDLAHPCQAEGMKDSGKCLLPRSAHEGPCPKCNGFGEYEGEYGPIACMGCLTGLGPYGHAFVAEAV